MKFKNTLYEKNESTATITINRPKVLNALNEETILEILSRLEDAEEDEAIRVIIVTGAGDRAFSAGADIKTIRDLDLSKARDVSRLGHKLCDKIEELGKPVIAAINGYALGGGLELAMACDIRIASENVRLGQSEIKLGLIPGWGGTQRLPRFVGKSVAKEMIYTGKMIDAKMAERLGLVNVAVPLDQLRLVVEEFAKEIADKPPISIKLAKELINSSLETSLKVGEAHEAEAFGMAASTEDFREGVAAFLEKRKPKFEGR
ncbi:MAG: enoyl-CoA hydratase/isomerase family protein [Candidatus Bathyarchaeota archaeon]|nr:MAG: enoyl-CoA hydratase/isomerase family protein [Candidatus Bathyarchaeota archaeon]